MTREETIKTIENEKLIVIMRGIPAERITSAVEALYRGGIRLAEIAYDAKGNMTDDETENCIRTAAAAMRGKMLIGAGTVLTEEQVERTKRAGGSFIIAPNTDPAIIRKTRELSLVSVPGALTPTEIVTAHKSGADFVKVFPAGQMGVSYFKAIRTPLSHVKLLAVAGITPDNIPEFLKAGAAGFGVSSGIITSELVFGECFDEITKRAKEYVGLCKGDPV